MTTLHESATPPASASHDDNLPRADRVAEATVGWVAELAALGGKDPLLHFRDLKVGTLDLAAADAGQRDTLLAGEPVLVSRLFPHEPLRSSALRSARAIRDKSRELAAEHGIETAKLAVGIATWSNPFAAHRPSAPLLLRHVRVTARDPAETDFAIEVSAEAEVNPVLLRALDEQLGLRFGPASLRDVTGALRYPVVVERLREFAPAHVVDGFSIAHRAVLGTFAVEPQLARDDVDGYGPAFARHEVISALAGDPAAGRVVRDAGGSAGEPEFLVLEADSEQARAIAAVAAGQSVRVVAPPGTGRTQTIANVVAELVGRGRQVLVVGNKRATLTDLSGRLAGAGLSDVVVDLSTPVQGAAGVAAIVDRVERLTAAKAGDANSGDDPNNTGDANGGGNADNTGDALRGGSGRTASERDPMDGYLHALHQRRDPWGCSAYQLIAAVAAADSEARTDIRIPEDKLRGLGPGSREAMTARLRVFTELGGLVLGREPTPWSCAKVPTSQVAEELRETVTTLRVTALPELRNAATRAAVEAGLAAPKGPREAFDTVDLLTSVAATMSEFEPALWNSPLDEFVSATADRGTLSPPGERPGFLTRRRLRLQIRDLEKQPTGRRGRAELHARLAAAQHQLAEWRERARDPRPPRTGEHLPAAVEAAATVRRLLDRIHQVNPRGGELAELTFVDLAVRLSELADDEATLMALPRLATLRAELDSAGLADLLKELTGRHPDPDLAEAVFAYAWQASLLKHLRDSDQALGAAWASAHDTTVAASQTRDAESLATAAARVLAARALRFTAVHDQYEGQVAVVLESAKAGTGPATLHELVAAAPNLTLAAAPCWVMPPLRVPVNLPPRKFFDVVVVEDAGTLSPAEAIPALARADQVILVGDAEQTVLPPFTTAVEPVRDTDEQPPPFNEASGPLAVSVFEQFSEILPSLTLPNGYRYRDERLVGQPASGIYAGRLQTLPGVGGPSPLRHELVTVDDSDDADSSAAEVDRVVALILEHARVRPHESLGVVTLSGPHADRVASALRTALIRSPDVAPVLRGDRDEPFFVKDVEQVSADVRDAIILSLGYGRSVDGRVLYRFGALDRPGGDRRLAAAVTRSRIRTTVVSSFSADDLSPRRLTTDGGRALRDFLAAIQSPPRPDGASGDDPLALVVAERLRAAGAEVEVGTGGIEVAVRHPLRRDRFVLAVLTDGRAYARAARRERDGIRPRLLTALGWSIHRVWSTAWIADPDGENARLVDAYARAVADADAYDWAVAAAEADVVAGMPDEGSDRSAMDEASRAGEKDASNASGEDEASNASGEDETSQAAAEESAPSGEDRPDTSPAEQGTPPAVPRGRSISAYTPREIAAIARWVESDGRPRSEGEVMAAVRAELAPANDGPRVDDVVRYAVRVARAGAPGI